MNASIFSQNNDSLAPSRCYLVFIAHTVNRVFGFIIRLLKLRSICIRASAVVGDPALFCCACYIDCTNSISRRKNSVPSPYTLRDVKNSSVSEIEDMFLFISRANRNSFLSFISV
jgi:hypothetical protein